jgi:hypothetical protein
MACIGQDNLKQLRKALKDAGISQSRVKSMVLPWAARRHLEPDGGESGYSVDDRGAGIAAWLASLEGTATVKYVILDDDPGTFSPTQPLVTTDPDRGITDEDAERARKLLVSTPDALIADIVSRREVLLVCGDCGRKVAQKAKHRPSLLSITLRAGTCQVCGRAVSVSTSDDWLGLGD